MASINEIKEKIGVVKSVGGFANALQQIAAMRMVSLRDKVLSSKRFVDEATEVLRELNLQREIVYRREHAAADKLAFKRKKADVPEAPERKALIIVTSNQGLCGKYNAEIFKQLEGHILKENADSDIFIIGKKGQEHYLANKKYAYRYYPYALPDEFTSADLLRLVEMFPYYQRILMVYSRYINTINREVVETLLVAKPSKQAFFDPKNKEQAAGASDAPVDPEIAEMEQRRYIFEPSIEELIRSVSATLRAATFQQQIFDSRLAQFSAQMVGMQAAAENAKTLLTDLGHEYNKQRRKLVDKKISEVLAGKALW